MTGLDGGPATGRPGWVRNGLRVAATSGRRHVRRLLASPRSTAVRALAYVGVWVALRRPWEGRGPGELAGAGLPAGVEVLPLYRSALTGLWLVTFVVAAVGATRSLEALEVDTAVVRAAGLRATLVGRLVVEHARRLLLIGVVVVVEGLALVAGGGLSPLFAVGLLGLVGLEVTAGLAGEVAALGYTAVSGRRLLGDYTPFGVAALWIVAVVVVTRWTATVVETVALSPTGWFADLLLLGTPGVEADPTLAAGAVLFGTVGTVVLFGLEERLAARVWFDPSGGTDGTASGGRAAAAGLTDPGYARSSRLPRALAARLPVSPAVRAVAWRVTTRALRRPRLLYLLAFPVIVAVAVVLSADSHRWYPVATAVAGAWAAGAGVALNPLSNEGDGLAGLLTAPVSPRALQAGYVVSGVALAVPLVVLPTVAVGVIDGLPTAVTAGAVGLGLVCSVPAATVAFAVGTGLPRLGATAVSEAGAPMPPTQVTTAVYSLLVGVLVAPGALGLLVPGLAVGPVPAPVAGLLATAGLCVAAGAVAVRYADRRLGALELSA